jgi:membrane protease YdiL (CAAX protease family)
VKRDAPALVFAMTFPSVMAWVYFVALAPSPTNATEAGFLVRTAYSAAKAVQFLFPVVWSWLWERSLPRPVPPRRRDVLLGLLFGATVAAVALALFYGVYRDSSAMRGAAGRFHAKMMDFGLNTPVLYLLFAAFLSVFHSLLEEYYWRWFVYGRLRRHAPPSVALPLASLAFMAHHVIILAMFFPGRWLEMIVPLSLGVAAGGGLWCWLYEKTRNLYAAWISHACIDAAILFVGYDMEFLHRN